jgi:hypothetical protein
MRNEEWGIAMRNDEVGGVTRRSALRAIAGGTVGVATAVTWVESLTALAHQDAHAHAASSAVTAQDWTPRVFTAKQNEAVIALTELIIPQTETPGAKAALVNRFIDGVLQRAPQKDREMFVQRLSWMDARSAALFGKDFLAAGPENQVALLTRLSKDGGPAAAAPEDRDGAEFFEAIKSMTITGYYTTEIGLHQELGDDGVLFQPSFKGCDHPEHQV